MRALQEICKLYDIEVTVSVKDTTKMDLVTIALYDHEVDYTLDMVEPLQNGWEIDELIKYTILFGDILKTFVALKYSNRDWLEHYLRDRRLGILQGYAEHLFKRKYHEDTCAGY